MTHLPGTLYTEKDDGKAAVVPMSQYSSYESTAPDSSYGSYFGKDFSPSEYETRVIRDPATGQSSTVLTTYQQKQPLVQMATGLKSPQSTTVRQNHQPQVIYSGSLNSVAFPTVLYSSKPPKSKGHGLKLPRITDLLFSTMNGRSKPRNYASSNPQTPVFSVFENGVSSPNQAVVATSPEYSPTKTQDTSMYQYASTQAYYPPSSQSYAQYQYYPSPSPTPSQKYQETVYAEPYSQPEIQYMPPPPLGNNNNEHESPHSPSPSYDGQQGSSHHHVHSHTPTPTYSPYDTSHSQGHSSSHAHSEYYQHSGRTTSKPTSGPPLRVYYPKDGSTPAPKYSKYDSKHSKDYPQTYYKQKEYPRHSHGHHKHQDYSASASHDVHHVTEGDEDYPPPRSHGDPGHKKHKNHEGPQEFAYFPVDSGYAFTTYPPPGQNHKSKAPEYAPAQYVSHNSPDYSNGYRPSQVYDDVHRQPEAGQYDTSTEYTYEPPPRPPGDYIRDSGSQPGAHYPPDFAPSVEYSRGPPPPGTPVEVGYTVSPPTTLPKVEVEYPQQIPSVPVRVEHIHEPSRHYPQNYPDRPPPFSPPGTYESFQQKDVIPEPQRSSSHRHKPSKTTHRVEHIYHNSHTESPYYKNENVDSNFLKRSQDGTSKHRSSSSHGKGHHHSSKYSSSKSHKKGSKSKSGSSYYSSRHDKGYHRPSSSKSSSHHRYSSKGKHSSRPHSSRRDQVYYTPREFYETLKQYYEDRGYYDRPRTSYSSRTLKVGDATSKGKGSSSSSSSSSISSRAKQEKSSRDSSSSQRDHDSHKEKVTEVIVLKRKDPTVLVPREPLHERQAYQVSSSPQPYSMHSAYQQPTQATFHVALSSQLSVSGNAQQATNPPQYSTSPQFTSPAPSNSPPSITTVQSSPGYGNTQNHQTFSQVYPPAPQPNPASNPANVIPVNTYPTATTYHPRSSPVTPAAYNAPPQNPSNSYSSAPNTDTIVPHASIEAIVKALDVFK